MEPNFLYDLRKKYGSIFSVNIKNQEIAFRELTFNEYDKVVEYKNSDDPLVDAEDYIISSAVVYPENFDANSLSAGAASSLAQEIVDFSGFYSPSLAKQILESKRQTASEVRGLMKAFVLSTISSYRVTELDSMTFSQLAELVALSEKIIEINQNSYGIEPTSIKLLLIDPEEEQQKKKTSAARHNLSRKEGEAAYEDPIAQKLWGMQ